MATMRDGVMVHYDIVVDKNVPVTVEYVTNLENTVEALGMTCSISKTLMEAAFKVARGELGGETYRNIMHEMMQQVQPWKNQP